MPTWVKRATADSPDGWNSRRALAELDEGQRREVADAAATAGALCKPMDRERLIQRLTALGMVLAPNRPPAEASMWVRETARLLADIAEQPLCDAIDDLQKRLKFLPTVAEIRELAEPVMVRRRKEFSRLDAMRRYLESGQPVGQFVQVEHKRSVMDRRGERMSEAETAELNGILERLGACSRYRLDGSRYQVSKRSPAMVKPDRPQMPTRADYIAWGIDPAVLDQIEAERAASRNSAAG